MFQDGLDALMDGLLAEVESSPAHVRNSLPELKYLDRMSFGRHPINLQVTTAELLSDDGDHFEVQILRHSTMGTPGEFNVMIYLRDTGGNLLDWKSIRNGARAGGLKTELLTSTMTEQKRSAC